MNEKQIIQTLMLKIEECRNAQQAYFNNKNDVNLRLSKGNEAELDSYLKHLKRMGYKPEQNNNNATQKAIF